MDVGEIRERVLADHLILRGILSSLESLSQRLLDGDREVAGALRSEGEAFFERLAAHMGWEDAFLAPALPLRERAEQLSREHREQRELLRFSLDRLRDPSRPAQLLAGNLLDLVALLRADMEEEETTVLGALGPPGADDRR